MKISPQIVQLFPRSGKVYGLALDGMLNNLERAKAVHTSGGAGKGQLAAVVEIDVLTEPFSKPKLCKQLIRYTDIYIYIILYS